MSALDKLTELTFRRLYPSRADRRIETVENAFRRGYRHGFHRAVHQWRVERAYLLGLRRGYRYGSTTKEKR